MVFCREGTDDVSTKAVEPAEPAELSDEKLHEPSSVSEVKLIYLALLFNLLLSQDNNTTYSFVLKDIMRIPDEDQDMEISQPQFSQAETLFASAESSSTSKDAVVKGEGLCFRSS